MGCQGVIGSRKFGVDRLGSQRKSLFKGLMEMEEVAVPL